MDELMNEPDNAGKYQVNSDGTVQGQVTGDNNKVEIHIHNPHDKTTSPTKPQRVWNIPYLRNDYFTGREEILEQLHTRFKANNTTALSQRHAMSGLGGIGKTQIAVQYAYEHHQDYQAVLWARAESYEAFTSSFVEIATLLELPQKDEQDQTIIVQAVKRWLQDNSGWLLILDNADEPAVVREFLPTKFDGRILLTTRAQALGGLAQRIEVDMMKQDIGALLLLRRAGLVAHDASLDIAAPTDITLAREITRELGGLPLALDQAGAYIEETACSLSEYLNLYRTRRIEVLKERGGLVDDHPEPVATTWSLSFQRVEEKNAAAADLLRLCAFLHPDAIPEEIITAGAEHLGPLLQTATSDPMALNKAIVALGAYSLIRRDATEKTLSIHRLVQATLRDSMDIATIRRWLKRAIRIVLRAHSWDFYRDRDQLERVYNQAQACIELLQEYPVSFSKLVDLFDWTGHYLAEFGRYQKAQPLLEQVLQIREQVHGMEHEKTGEAAHTLAWLYRRMGKYAEAEPLFLHALAIYKQQLEPEHFNVGNTMNVLAFLYMQQGRYAEAEPMFLHALAIYEQQLEREHTAFCLGNLAQFYIKQGKYEEAEQFCQRSLIIREEELGAKHPHTAQSLHILGIIYRRQEKYTEAELLYQRGLEIYEPQLGREHPDTQSLRQSYAILLRAMGRDEEAKQLEEGNES
jgi:tetratricopeptide (TPR) repeat protein